MARYTFKKIIVTEKTLENINPKNKELTKQFLKHKATSVSPLTIKGYQSDLDIFFSYNYLYNENRFFVDIRKIEFSTFFSYAVDELKWGAARRNRLRSTLSSLSIFIERMFDDSYPEFRNIILKAVDSAMKSPRREKTILSDEQVDRLLLHLSKTSKQKACWLALAIGCGARHSELLRFELDMIDDAITIFDGVFLETSRKLKTKGRGREGKMLKKYILREMFSHHYDAWKIERREILSKNGVEEHNKLFVKKDGTPAKDSTIRSWVKGMGEYLGVNLYPHSLRHRTTTYLAEKNIPAQLIQFLMGWESTVMVDLYTDLDARDRTWSELDALK